MRNSKFLDTELSPLRSPSTSTHMDGAYQSIHTRTSTSTSTNTLPKERWKRALTKVGAAYEDFVKARTFVLGVGLGAAVTLFLISIAIMYIAHDPVIGQIHELIASGSYDTFRGSFLLCFWGLLMGVMQFIWRRCHVNYHAQIPAIGFVNYSSTLVVASSGFIIVFLFFITFVLRLISPAMFWRFLPMRMFPLMALLTPPLLLLWPTDRAPIFFFLSPNSAHHRYRLVREFLLATVGCVCAEPTFLRTLLADVLCSMPKLLTDVSRLCYDVVLKWMFDI